MARVRSPLGALRKVLVESPHPIWMLDQQRTVVFANHAVETWLGVSSEQILGKRCDYHWETADPSTVGVPAALGPPPEIHAIPQVIRVPTTVPRAAAKDERLSLFVPLLDSSGAVRSILGIGSSSDGVMAPTLPSIEEDAEESRDLHVQLGHLRRHLKQLYDLPQLIGESAAIHRVRAQVQLAARSGGRVVVQGPAGSGREHVARTIHFQGNQELARSLVPLSCSLLDAELLQSALSDWIPGPVDFGEDAAKAPPMTLLLLEADLLSEEAQAALMPWLEAEELDVHTLATSTQSLVTLAESKKFRPDLAHFLSTLVIELPPLNSRPEDIPLLVQFLLERRNVTGRRQFSGCTPETLDRLAEYEWPGNLDQLTEILQEACRRAEGSRIEARHLPEVLERAAEAVAHPRQAAEPFELDQFLQQVEAELLRRAMRRSKGNRARAARLLGISRGRLLRRLEQLRIEG